MKSNEALDNARKSICAELTRTYGDTLASFACIRGYLSADMPTTAAGEWKERNGQIRGRERERVVLDGEMYLFLVPHMMK